MIDAIDTSLCALFVRMYNERKAEGKNYVPASTVAKIVMIRWHQDFIKEGIIKDISLLPVEEKKELTHECRLSGEFFTNETLIERCKILYVIKTINSNT